MSLQCGQRVRITKAGLLAGQEGTITSISMPLLTVELDADDTLVMVNMNEVQPIQPVAESNFVQVRLPPGVPVHVFGHAVEGVFCVVRMPPAMHNWLQQQTGQVLPEVVLQDQSAPGPYPSPDLPLAQAMPAPGWGMPVPPQPQAVPPAAPPHPLGPVQQPPSTGVVQLPTPGEASRLHLARHLLEMFLHTRNNLLDAGHPPIPPGEEWKYGNADADDGFTLLPAEQRLYDTCCHALTTFIEPIVGLHGSQEDAVDG